MLVLSGSKPLAHARETPERPAVALTTAALLCVCVSVCVREREREERFILEASARYIIADG